jgi:curli biogenesis system outer membrane secretion channel CsgG
MKKTSRLFSFPHSLSQTGAVLIFFLCFSSLIQPAVGQDNPAPEKKRLCIGPIVAINSAVQKASKAGQGDALQQTLETLDTTLIDQANESRKFEVVARKDALKSLLNEQDFGASGNVDPATAAQAFKLAGAQYLVLTTVTDFVMGNEAVKFEGIGAAANREAVRISCSIQIYDTTTGKLIESARFRGQDANVSREGSATADGATLTKITDRLAADILNRIVDVIYPAKVVAKLGTQITINRGEGAGTAVGQTWTVFALGEEITDPDTGEKLGRNEAEIGKIKITSVTPKLSYGETVEDTGIAVGNIVRPQQASEQPETSSPAPSPAGDQKSKDINDKVKGDL